MWHDSLSRRTVASALALALLVQLSGCTSWSTQKQPPTQVLAEKPYTKLRVTRIDGKRLEVHSPRIVDDSLVGFKSKPVEGKEPVPVSIALADVKRVEVHKVDAGKTVLLVVGIGVTVALIAVAISSYEYDMNWDGGGGGDGGSCPLIYSWDGTNWRLESSAFAGARMPALQRTDLDNLAYARPEANQLRLRVASVPGESEYFDGLSIMAVDHRQGVSILTDATGLPALHAVAALTAPLSARDDAGRDMLRHVRASDGVMWESSLRARDAASSADARDGIQMVFERPRPGISATLVVEAQNTPWSAFLMGRLVRAWGREIAQWYDPATSASVASQMTPAIADEAFLSIQLRVNGHWETRGRVFETGPEVAKRIALPLDLTGVQSDSVEIRLESIPNFWLVDYAALGSTDDASFTAHEVALTSAVDRDGRDILQLLGAEDRSYFVMEHGDDAELTVKVPTVPAGLTRSYIVKASGWYRIHGRESAEPDRAFIDLVSGPQGPTRAAIQLTNDALAGMH